MHWVQLWKQCNCFGNTDPSTNPHLSRYLITQIKSTLMSLDNLSFSDLLVISHAISRFWNSVLVCCRTKIKRFHMVAKATTCGSINRYGIKCLEWISRDFNLTFPTLYTTPPCMLGFLGGFEFLVFSSSSHSRQYPRAELYLLMTLCSFHGSSIACLSHP